MVDIRMTKARSALVIKQPFFGTLALQLEIVEEPSVETMSTDSEKLFYAPAFLDAITPEELKGVIVHEVLHCAYRHPTRRKHRDPKLWNEACDYVVNQDVLAAGFTLPADRLLDTQYKEMSAEEVYARLSRQQLKQVGANGSSGTPKTGPNSGPGVGQGPRGGTTLAGNGQTQPGDQPSPVAKGQKQGPKCPWGKVQDLPFADPATIAASNNRWAVRVVQALSIAKKAGTLPGELERLATAVKKPIVDWREELRRFIDDRIHTDFTWTNPNKRYLNSGFVMPGVQKDSIAKLGVAIDTSGSIDQRTLNQFRAEIQDILDNGAVAEIVLLFCDAEVQGLARSFVAGDIVDMKAKGGGGTKFSPAIEWFNKFEPDITALIYLTDLECDDFGPEPPFSVLWAGYGYESRLDNKKVPFGEIIKLVES